MPSNLTPVVVTDKNGRVTTVYKKNAKAGKAKLIPAPKKHDYRAEVTKALNAQGVVLNDEQSMANFSYLAEHAPKLCSDIIDRIARNDDEGRYWRSMLQYKKMFSSTTPETTNAYLDECHATVKLYPVAAKVLEALNSSAPANAMITVLIRETIFQSGGYMRSNSWDLMGMAMVTRQFVADAHERDGVNDKYCNRIPEVLDLLPELGKRGSVDSETFSALMDSGNKSLREGEI